MKLKQQNCPNCGNPGFPDEKYHDITADEDEKIRFECHDCWEDFPKTRFTETVGSIEFTEEESAKLQEKIKEYDFQNASPEEKQGILLGIVEEVKGVGVGTLKEAVRNGVQGIRSSPTVSTEMKK